MPADKQQEVLNFVEYLQQKVSPKRSRLSLKGLYVDLKIQITKENIAQSRREMWGSS